MMSMNAFLFLLCVICRSLIFMCVKLAFNTVRKCMCVFRNLSMNPIVAIEPGAFRGLTDLDRL